MALSPLLARLMAVFLVLHYTLYLQGHGGHKNHKVGATQGLKLCKYRNLHSLMTRGYDASRGKRG